MRTYQMGYIIKELETRISELQYTQNEYKLEVEDHNKITEALKLIMEVQSSIKAKYTVEKMKEKKNPNLIR